MTAAGLAKRSTIRRRFLSLVAVAAAAVVTLCAVILWTAHRTQSANEWVAHTVQVLREVSEFSDTVSRAESALRDYLLTSDIRSLRRFKGLEAESSRRLAHLVALTADNPVEQANLHSLGEALGRKFATASASAALAARGDATGAVAMINAAQARQVTDEVWGRADRSVAVETGLLASRRNAAAADERNVEITVLAGALLTIVILFLAGYKLVFTIERQLKLLLRGSAAVGNGDFHHRVEVLANDETGRAARAFNEMAAHLLAAMRAREAVEEDLRRSNEDLDAFAYVASHDLKAPLRGIRNLSEWITTDVKATASADTLENLSLLRNRVERLDMLLDSLLQYSRIGRIGGDPEAVDVAQMLADVAGYLSPPPGFTIRGASGLPVMRTPRAPPGAGRPQPGFQRPQTP